LVELEKEDKSRQFAEELRLRRGGQSSGPTSEARKSFFSFFGSQTANVNGVEVSKSAINFGGARKPAETAVKQVPELKRWKQNPDGTLTGFIYRSKSFTPGTRVTTSPVRGIVTAGRIVKTTAGSEYKLG
jgi:hypothetical protein